ncbi:hypothetical protein INT47_000357 [Mucor saturninus]|uniref:Uncharacterized protein n=1 Tax=Mucor saturninus TaxID=64648 RepID=A0A8H7QX81_9FUNG|nr:hypothetical protein INT47_000357 [Mucor saturninus]
MYVHWEGNPRLVEDHYMKWYLISDLTDYLFSARHCITSSKGSKVKERVVPMVLQSTQLPATREKRFPLTGQYLCQSHEPWREKIYRLEINLNLLFDVCVLPPPYALDKSRDKMEGETLEMIDRLLQYILSAPVTIYTQDLFEDYYKVVWVEDNGVVINS